MGGFGERYEYMSRRGFYYTSSRNIYCCRHDGNGDESVSSGRKRQRRGTIPPRQSCSSTGAPWIRYLERQNSPTTRLDSAIHKIYGIRCLPAYFSLYLSSERIPCAQNHHDEATLQILAPLSRPLHGSICEHASSNTHASRLRVEFAVQTLLPSALFYTLTDP